MKQIFSNLLVSTATLLIAGATFAQAEMIPSSTQRRAPGSAISAKAMPGFGTLTVELLGPHPVTHKFSEITYSGKISNFSSDGEYHPIPVAQTQAVTGRKMMIETESLLRAPGHAQKISFILHFDSAGLTPRLFSEFIKALGSQFEIIARAESVDPRQLDHRILTSQLRVRLKADPTAPAVPLSTVMAQNMDWLNRRVVAEKARFLASVGTRKGGASRAPASMAKPVKVSANSGDVYAAIVSN